MITVCTPYRRLSDGTLQFAKDFGLKAFCFEVTPEEHEAYWAKRGKTPPKRYGKKKGA